MYIKIYKDSGAVQAIIHDVEEFGTNSDVQSERRIGESMLGRAVARHINAALQGKKIKKDSLPV